MTASVEKSPFAPSVSQCYSYSERIFR